MTTVLLITGSMSYSRYFWMAMPAATGISGSASSPRTGLPNTTKPMASSTMAITAA